jgi:hypothetical protein
MTDLRELNTKSLSLDEVRVNLDDLATGVE